MSIDGLDRRSAQPLWRRAYTRVVSWLDLLTRPPRRVGAMPDWREAGRLQLAVGAAVVVILATMVLIDHPVAVLMHGTPAWLREVTGFVTEFGKSGWLLWPIGVALIVVAVATPSSIEHAGQLIVAAVAVRLSFVFAAVALPGLFVSFIKRQLGRGRPYLSNGDDPFLFAPFSWDVNYTSLPSGHATTAFAALVAIGAVAPRLRPALWTYAMVIGLSRVVLNVHHVSDVVAGALVGTVGALLVRDWFAARRLGFSVLADGRMRPFPGPSWRRLKTVAQRLAAE